MEEVLDWNGWWEEGGRKGGRRQAADEGVVPQEAELQYW